MQKRETYKDMELDGRKWRIRKFDPLTGSYILYTLMSKMLPVGIASQVGIPLPKASEIMTKEDFFSLQKDCLSVCKELQEVGSSEVEMPVMMPNGSWGIQGMEDNTNIVLTLTIHALIFNISSFFDPEALKELTGSFKDLKLFNAAE